jgi:hypothetical protein
MQQPATKYEEMFSEITALVSGYKEIEYLLVKAMSTPLQMMQLFRGAKNILIH